MTKYITILLLLTAFCAVAQKENKYPTAPMDEVYNTYHDTTIYDPYQWMEDPNDERLDSWLKEQKKINAKQERHQVGLNTLIRQLVHLQNNVGETTLSDSLSFTKTSKKPKYEINRINNSYTETPDISYRLYKEGLYKMLAKAKDFKADKHDIIQFGSVNINDKLDIAALPVQRNGGDWREIHFYNLKTNTKLPEILYDIRSSKLIWETSGVYYTRYDTPAEDHELLSHFTGQRFCYHQFGNQVEDDKQLYHHPDKSGALSFYVWTVDSLNIGIQSHIYSGNKILRSIGFSSIQSPDSFSIKNILYLPNDDDIDINIETIIDNKLIIRTNWNAPNGTILTADKNKLNQVSKLVPEFDVTLVDVKKFGKDKLVARYKNGGKYSAVFFNLNGDMLYKQDFDEGKIVNHLYENSDTLDYTLFCISSFYHPDLWYQISLEDYKITPIEGIEVPYKPEGLETKYVEYPSKDGTMIPMYITCKKGTKLTGKNPVKLYAYGGYGKSIKPNYNKWETLWVLHGGILAIPNVRGSGAKGNKWAQEGRGLKKQNSIDDFNAAAEYLIKNKYTNSQKIISEGASHGGMLVAAAAIQRPELYKAVVAINGPMDMLRFEKYTVGGANLNNIEFGVTSDPKQFLNLCHYSPMHNIKEDVSYPNFLLVTGEKDHRVPPIHSYKFLSTLQEKGNPESLYQMYLIKNAGHNLYTNPSEYTDYLLFKSYFMYHQVGLKY